MKQRKLSFNDWSVTARIYGPIDRLSEGEVNAMIVSPAEDFPEDIKPRLLGAYTVMQALRLCQPDFFANEDIALEIDRTVGLTARRIQEDYMGFDSKKRLKEETSALDDSNPVVLDCIEDIIKKGKLTSEVRGVSEAIVRHIYKVTNA